MEVCGHFNRSHIWCVLLENLSSDYRLNRPFGVVCERIRFHHNRLLWKFYFKLTKISTEKGHVTRVFDEWEINFISKLLSNGLILRRRRRRQHRNSVWFENISVWSRIHLLENHFRISFLIKVQFMVDNEIWQCCERLFIFSFSDWKRIKWSVKNDF